MARISMILLVASLTVASALVVDRSNAAMRPDVVAKALEKMENTWVLILYEALIVNAVNGFSEVLRSRVSSDASSQKFSAYTQIGCLNEAKLSKMLFRAGSQPQQEVLNSLGFFQTAILYIV